MASNQIQLSTFINDLTLVVPSKCILTRPSSIKRYSTGFRSGGGTAIAVLIPESLVELWRMLKVCVKHDKIIIMQAAKTGLTEGSTPNGDDYDRDVVIISTLKINQLHLLDHGKQVISLPGTTLYQLENVLKPLKREPHSVIGSSCIGASVIGGICNNSGGALVKRGPAYTELALFAQLDEHGDLKLINHLGIELGSDPEEILTRLETGQFDKDNLPHTDKLASDHEYDKRVRDIDADTPSRFNADKRRLYEASGSAGKLAVFAVRLDTFEQAPEQQVFYIGTNNELVLTELRRHMLSKFDELPVAGEYMHRDMYDISERYGKDTFMMINKFGTDKMPLFFAFKGQIDTWLNMPVISKIVPKFLTDKVIQLTSRLFKNQLPEKMQAYRDKYEHHLMLRMSGKGVIEARTYLGEFFADKSNGDFFECTADVGKKAFLHRFAAAGAAIRYHAIHHKISEGVLALDIALARNEKTWFEQLPPEIDNKLISKLYYGHFMCYVFHQDYIVKKGEDMTSLKEAMLKLLDGRKAQYPAEHNVGHLYYANQDLVNFYKKSDPTNSFNPGIGKTTKLKNWCDCEKTH
ncbi:D-lactate dehydrogenase [Thorsellia anophelis]|uniref:Quinone-dependent D-lactate dehydrogenase n=1 Tax=Thorsellia anophelis DSM 18579 TaxID=1123402 RepID=A0A1I0DV55_9GAMM|nr:D-lactate dehydrogenase [Thorsellia anophelis]SET36404.1 D-lactate dehydrogenase [Thorsellia anophelis DSM 18579]